jgi:hypothetical protein
MDSVCVLILKTVCSPLRGWSILLHFVHLGFPVDLSLYIGLHPLPSGWGQLIGEQDHALPDQALGEVGS